MTKGEMRIQGAFSRRGTALLCILSLAMLAVAILALFGKTVIPVVEYKSRGDALLLPSVPIPQGDINVNTADAQTLSGLPGIGESAAAEIIREREANGPFSFPEDLLSVKGIGEKKLSGILPFIRLDEQP